MTHREPAPYVQPTNEKERDKKKAIWIMAWLILGTVMLGAIDVAWKKEWVAYQGGRITRMTLPYMGTIMYGLIDALLFFIVEEELFHYIDSMFQDMVVTTLVISTVSGFFAIFMGKSVQSILEKALNTSVEATPIQEAIGLVLGSVIIIALYKAGLFAHLAPNNAE
jgi:cation transport ATPase